MKTIFLNLNQGLLILAGSFVLLSSCTQDDKVIPTDCTGSHWEYEGMDGPQNWDDLCTGYLDCGGHQQSPIDISKSFNDPALSAITYSYTPTAANILNNGHTIQFNQDAGSSITLSGQQYNLLQFHFHTSSEHLISGASYPMEVHLVHKNPATGGLAVIGVFVDEGTENPVLKQFLDHIPEHHDETYTAADQYSATGMLPAGTGYYTYDGSLTTPPCSEIVTWIVMKDHLTASSAQIHHIENLEHHNNRPVQGLFGRPVRSFN